MTCCRTAKGRAFINLKVTPGASKTAWAGEAEGRLRVRVAAAPEDGKANAALCAFVAKGLGCAKKEVILEAGGAARLKTISIPLAYLERFMVYCKK
ncbi:MAG: DUF167 domain-containing protein [Treponema sp.]|jgi:uncharacterized protein (TIGR00251 family)|nr:DUF167 domain-containing protein [Treponema sp.]